MKETKWHTIDINLDQVKVEAVAIEKTNQMYLKAELVVEARDLIVKKGSLLVRL
jgi:hypothetical protein